MPEQDSQFANRIRENKRRYRSRRKEYVADLERKLALFQQQGVSVTKEVQIAARKVAQENKRLRQLLNHHGVGDNAIVAWLRDGEISVQKPADSDVSAKEPSCFLLSEEKATEPRSCGPTVNSVALSIQHMATHSEPITADTTLPARNSSPKQPCHSDKHSRVARPLSPPGPPCKLLSHLAANPNADLRQIPVPASDGGQDRPLDGLECSEAYRTLMEFATTDEKLDLISNILEEGCSANDGDSKGGCRVKNSAMLKALDKVIS